LVAFSDVLLLLLNSNTPRADAAEPEFDAAANPVPSMNSDVGSPEAGSLPSMSLPVGGIVPPTDSHCAYWGPRTWSFVIACQSVTRQLDFGPIEAEGKRRNSKGALARYPIVPGWRNKGISKGIRVRD
jgi:hypothetical protein